MMDNLYDFLVTSLDSSFIFKWVISLVIVIFVLTKVLPPVINSLNKARNKINYGEDLMKMVNNHENSIKEINKKLTRDYRDINEIKTKQYQMEQVQKDSLDERALIMESLLAIIEGMQKYGQSESTMEIQKKLHRYLNRQAHLE